MRGEPRSHDISLNVLSFVLWNDCFFFPLRYLALAASYKSARRPQQIVLITLPHGHNHFSRRAHIRGLHMWLYHDKD